MILTMINKLWLCCFLSTTVNAVVFSDDSCWGQTSVKDLKTLFPYCELILGSTRELENNDVFEKVCNNIKEILDINHPNESTFTKFNNCMELKVGGPELIQIKRLKLCLGYMSPPDVSMKDVANIMFEHIHDNEIFVSVVNYFQNETTMSDPNSIDTLINCLYIRRKGT